MPTPSPFDNTPKSQRLRDLLRQSIADANLQPGDRLPSEPELIVRYGVSRSTVREAITALTQEGLLRREQGKGTFVSEPKARRRTFAVVLPFLFFSDLLPMSAGTDVQPRLMQAIEGETRRAGANLLLYLDNHLPALERENLENLVQRPADGVLLNYIGGAENRDVLESLRASGTPLVLIDSYLDDLAVDFVVTDNALGAYRATRLLIAQGVGRVVYITSPGGTSALRDRRAAYERAMAEAGLPASVREIDERRSDAHGIDEVSEEKRSYRLAVELLAVDELATPFAILAADAPILAGVWRAIQERGLSSFAPIALGCFDEPFLPIAADVFTVKVIQPFAEIGRRSVAILQERCAKRGPTEPYRVFVEPEIVTSKV